MYILKSYYLASALLYENAGFIFLQIEVVKKVADHRATLKATGEKDWQTAAMKWYYVTTMLAM